ncbi:MAG: formylglycine-generating enzyme family protein [Deltaproteobacteria bacterium]|nr:formylglycine-generating enzyme family protein [Deltaproteobacteria bacterium]
MIPSLLAMAGALWSGIDTERVDVGPGEWRPVYPPSPGEDVIPVKAFQLAVYPVTVGDYEAFVDANPEWKRGRVDGALAGDLYLSRWASPTRAGMSSPGVPVTEVSWFAARAYCRWTGGRLPTEAEWELAGAADETRTDASRDPAFVKRILDWYSRPNPAEWPAVGQGEANAWGLHDMHGMVWEWVDDFNASLVNVDNRDGKGKDELRFCGGGAAAAATDKADYAAFLRIALRSSLEGRSTVRSLGFRCAFDEEAP